MKLSCRFCLSCLFRSPEQRLVNTAGLASIDSCNFFSKLKHMVMSNAIILFVSTKKYISATKYYFTIFLQINFHLNLSLISFFYLLIIIHHISRL